MTYITMGQAEQIVPVARSTFRKHAKAGKFSTSKNPRGLQIVQIAELERYYEKLKPFPEDIKPVDTNGHPDTTESQDMDGNGQPDTTDIDKGGQTDTPDTAEIANNGQVETGDTPEVNGNGQPETTAQTQEIIELLKSQLADTKSELADAKERETKLLSMLETEQEKTRVLMLPPPEQIENPTKKKKPSIWGYFRLKR